MLDLNREFIDKYKLLMTKPKIHWTDEDSAFHDYIRTHADLGQLALLRALGERFQKGGELIISSIF